MGHPRAWARCPSCGEGRVHGQNPDVIYPGQRPGRVLRFLPARGGEGMERRGLPTGAGAYMAAEMMCFPGHKGLKDRRAVRLVAAAGHGLECPIECLGAVFDG